MFYYGKIYTVIKILGLEKKEKERRANFVGMMGFSAAQLLVVGQFKMVGVGESLGPNEMPFFDGGLDQTEMALIK